jgi:uncharacterized protein YbaR (Trm112 family)
VVLRVAKAKAIGVDGSADRKEEPMALNKELIDILACPKCTGALTLLPAGDGLACPACAVVYPVKDDIPIMLVDQAVPDTDWTGSRD